MTLIIAGYPTAPADADAHQSYYRRLAQVEPAGGLGLPWRDAARTEAEIIGLLPLLPAHWVFTLTAIPAIAAACAQDHRFGLASPDAEGRQAAMAQASDIAATVAALNHRLGRRAIIAVELHSAPGFGDRRCIASPAALLQSLDALRQLDWGGAEIMIEHCDAYVEGQVPAKGFLTLSEEIATLQALAGSPVSLSLNWGRSLIELQHPDAVLQQVQQTQASGLLRGFTVSGASGQANPIGGAWVDSHLPFAVLPEPSAAEPASQLTLDRAAAALAATEELLFVAIKTVCPRELTDPLARADALAANVLAVAGLQATTS